MEQVSFTLSYPVKTLNLNVEKKTHWSKIANCRRDQREEAFYLFKNALFDLDFHHDQYYIFWLVHPPDNRNRDVTNIDFKAAQDGIFDILEQDDSCVIISANVMKEKDPDKKGFVEVRIGNADNERCNFLWR